MPSETKLYVEKDLKNALQKADSELSDLVYLDACTQQFVLLCFQNRDPVTVTVTQMSRGEIYQSLGQAVLGGDKK